MLTHEEAAVIRFGDVMTPRVMHILCVKGFVDVKGERTLTGIRALAEYDAAHVTIPRALLAELEDFVAKWGCGHDYHAELLERTRAALKNP